MKEGLYRNSALVNPTSPSQYAYLGFGEIFHDPWTLQQQAFLLAKSIAEKKYREIMACMDDVPGESSSG